MLGAPALAAAGAGIAVVPAGTEDIALQGVVRRPLTVVVGVDIMTVTGQGELPGPVSAFLACRGPPG
ncbi:hypothetical protein LRE75_36155 [Streptomyces sp. 372A]|uniref:hypothetical protein n=1 Tax=Streptomyces sp. SAS_281 TaxID=3412744 RepID=UPI00403CEDDD